MLHALQTEFHLIFMMIPVEGLLHHCTGKEAEDKRANVSSYGLLMAFN